MNFTKNTALGLAGLCMAGLALAGDISGVKIEPASTQVGAAVKVIISGTDEGICGLRVEYGNGDVDVTKMSKGKDDFPRSFSKTYNKPGTYTVIAKGGRDGSTFGCNGEAKAQVVVAEAPKPAAAAVPVAAAPMAAAACPEGFLLNSKSVNKKTGAYTCNAKKGAIKPEKALACPAGTEYFATPKGSSLGCRVPRAAARK